MTAASASGLTPLSIMLTHVARVSLSNCVFNNCEISYRVSRVCCAAVILSVSRTLDMLIDVQRQAVQQGDKRDQGVSLTHCRGVQRLSAILILRNEHYAMLEIKLMVLRRLHRGSYIRRTDGSSRARTRPLVRTHAIARHDSVQITARGVRER